MAKLAASFLLPVVIAFAPCSLKAETVTQAKTDIYSLTLAELANVEISIATGNRTPIDKAPATASVIYAADIESMGAKTLNDILEVIPGLHVSLSTLSRLDSVYSIRGIHTGFNPQVLLLINGVPVQFSAQGSRPVLFRLPAAGIDRVEVIRGPGSAIYGADAYSGVINVITKDSSAIRGTHVGAGTGSIGSRDVWVNSASQFNEWSVAFNMAYQEGDGDDSRVVYSDLQSQLDTLLGTRATEAPNALSTGYKVLDSRLTISSENLHVNLWGQLLRDMGVGAGAAQALDPSGTENTDLIMADLNYQLPSSSDHWNHNLRLSYFYYDDQAEFVLFPEGTSLPIDMKGNINFEEPSSRLVTFTDGVIGNPSGTAKDANAEIISVYSGLDSHRFRVAFGVKNQTLKTHETKNYGDSVIDGSEGFVDGSLTDVTETDYSFLPDSERTIRYISLQDEWQLATGLVATTGVRIDDYSDVGSTTNPRIAFVWTASEQLTTKLLYGRAFRAPSFIEQGMRHNPVSLGNTNLHPENIETVELSIGVRVTDELKTQLTIFDYKATDMIEFVRDPGATTSTAQNVRNQDGKGLELEAQWVPTPAWKVSASYSLQHATDAELGTAIADAPRQLAKMNALWIINEQWQLSTQIQWVGDRPRNAVDSRSDIDNYTLINMTLHKKRVLPNLDVSLAFRNITDTDAREPSDGSIPEDYPLASRSAWLNLSYGFQ